MERGISQKNHDQVEELANLSELDIHNPEAMALEQWSIPLNILSALANSYHTMHLIDIKMDTVVEINSSLDVRRFQDPSLPVQDQIKQVLKNVLPESERPRVLSFMNLRTLPRRLKGKKSLSTEFVGLFSGWIRATFVPMNFDSNGLVTSVILYSRIIEKEKRREERLIQKSNIDELTDLLNRNAYEDAIRSLSDDNVSENTVFVSMDVNGLKDMNDKFGHGEGDKFLKGAADCIKRTIGKYGNVYRTGGDEFVAIIRLSFDELEEVKENFKDACEAWSARHKKTLTISTGYITKLHHPDMSMKDLIKQADQRMYRDKSQFYSKKGFDRRSQRSAFYSISKSYTKIIKVNLENETHEILQLEYDEKDLGYSFGNAMSAWLEHFVAEGYVHPDDVENFKSVVNLEKMRQHFEVDQSIIKTVYRRRYGDQYKKVMFEAIPTVDYATSDDKFVYFCIKVIE